MLNLAEQLLYTTVRLEGETETGSTVGTGFFFLHDAREFIVTNKHVIQGVKQGKFILQKSQFGARGEEPEIGQCVPILFDQNDFVGHPDPDIDVAVMDVSAKLWNVLTKDGIACFRSNITEDNFPKSQDYEKFIGPIEEIIFIGYPNGIWDSKNILPVVRRGITATPCYVNFEGEKKFLIDASVFPGSSGSPVFIYYAGGYPDKSGKLYIGNRMYFLGVVARVYQRVEQGEIKSINIPTAQKTFVETMQMIDIGIVYKSETVKETVEYHLKMRPFLIKPSAPVL